VNQNNVQIVINIICVQKQTVVKLGLQIPMLSCGFPFSAAKPTTSWLRV